ncbi:MAG: sporulation protein YqfC [Lachnospiraceae bacterium]|nr:sporulation protein YqfC [Lachnospiraceae bacterium]
MSNHNKETKTTIIESLELPKDLFLGMPNIHMIGNRELYISNHRGILAYSQEEIVILAKEFRIEITGKSLFINSFCKEELTISGYIHSLHFG